MRIGKIAAGLIAIAVVACFVRNARALTLEQEQAAQDLRDAEAVSKRHRAELMKIPHVTVVTGELDSQNEAAILVEVDDQKNIDSVMRQVPSKLEGFPVEIDEGVPESEQVLNYSHKGFGPPPTIDQQGYYHHAWSNPSAPATNSNAQP
ncbi:MAG: hypothetical protein WAU82_18370 [Candidatus Binatus sp.]|uniref:hypothetical protein n=1 Tax=Candidatus Binatus sp. TaxID=2811406 RepID=UPI003BB120B9